MSAQSISLASIERDAEFEGLNLGAAPSGALSEALDQDGFPEPLVVWNFHGRKILLIGYRLLIGLRLHNSPYQVIEKHFAHRQQAREFIVRYFTVRGLPTLLALSALRGLFYLDVRQPRGGKTRGQSIRTSTKSVEATAERLGVSRSTLLEDAKLARAVVALADVHGSSLYGQLLGADAKVSRGQILALAAAPEAEQIAALKHLRMFRRLPRATQDQSRRRLRELVERLSRRATLEEFEELYQWLPTELERKRRGEKVEKLPKSESRTCSAEVCATVHA